MLNEYVYEKYGLKYWMNVYVKNKCNVKCMYSVNVIIMILMYMVHNVYIPRWIFAMLCAVVVVVYVLWFPLMYVPVVRRLESKVSM